MAFSSTPEPKKPKTNWGQLILGGAGAVGGAILGAPAGPAGMLAGASTGAKVGMTIGGVISPNSGQPTTTQAVGEAALGSISPLQRFLDQLQPQQQQIPQKEDAHQDQLRYFFGDLMEKPRS